MLRYLWILASLFVVLSSAGIERSASSRSSQYPRRHPIVDQEDYPYGGGPRQEDGEIQDFDLWRFQTQVEHAVQAVKSILDRTRNPRLLSEQEPYVYNDKFLAAEFVTNTAIAAYVHALERMGLTRPILGQLWEATERNLSVPMLRFHGRVSCTYVGQEDVKVVVAEREVERNVAGSTFLPNSASTETTKVKKTVSQYVWDVQFSYNVTALEGDQQGNHSSHILLRNGTNSQTVITRVKKPPLDQVLDRTFDLQLTWLLQCMSPPITTPEAGTLTSTFSIDRLDASCKTPRRNDNVRDALVFDRELHVWASRIQSYILRVDRLQRSSQDADEGLPLRPHPRDMPLSESSKSRLVGLLEGSEMFIPIAPLMDNQTVMFNDVDAILAEHVRSVNEVLENVDHAYGANKEAHHGKTNESLIESEEAGLTLLCDHLVELSQAHADAVEYFEHLLKLQLQKAIGKNIGSQEFEQFLGKHFRTLLNHDAAIVEPFARSIRQPDHYPDGVLSIENANAANSNVLTLVRRVPAQQGSPIRLPINAATTLELAGDRFLHGWMLHWFAGRETSVQLVARARQFSSFLLILGSMVGPDEFMPKHAIILRNKDEALIPLLTEVLPSAKSFRDALETLSPEQQAFARAIRTMQLQSSVFGVCVIQLKPQLELLLNLPPGALTKEIELTEDLMSLFVDYQVPSDLLSYDLDGEATGTSRIDAVKGHVAKVMKVIQSMKEQQLQEERLKTEMRAEKAFSRAFEDMAASSAGSSPDRRQFRRALQAEFISTDDGLGPELGTPLALGLAPEPRNDPLLESRHEVPPIDEPRDVRGNDDFTLIPKELDARLEKYDSDGSLRSVILRPSDWWTLRSKETLLSPVASTGFGPDAIDGARKKAFDLLDAISRSGTLPIRSSELHVFVAVSHCFEKSIVETVIEDNVNPIEKLEVSMLLLASTIYNATPGALVSPHALERMKTALPELFLVHGERINDQASA